MRRMVVVLALLAVVAASCGGTEEGEAPEISTPSVEDLLDDPEQAVEDLADDLEQTQQAVGGGSATLTVGDESWTFNSVLCAIGEEQTRQEGAEFVLSSIQDGMQFYVSIDTFGHSVTLDDIEDFQNPSVALEARGPGDFIKLDGKNASGTGEFVDGTADDFATTEGSFEATCP